MKMNINICEKCTELNNIIGKKLLCRLFCSICGEYGLVYEVSIKLPIKKSPDNKDLSSIKE
jgi:hypothetical protein